MSKREVKISRNEYGLSTNPVYITRRQHLPFRNNLDRTTESIINYQGGIIGQLISHWQVMMKLHPALCV